MDLQKVIKRGQQKYPPRIFMIGEEKIGKSSFANDAPEPLFLCGENGLVGQQFESTANYTPSTWGDVKDFVKSVTLNDCKTLVIDTLDWLEPLLFAYVCHRDQKKSIEDYGFGKGYVIAAEEFRLFLAELERLNKSGIAIVVIAHCQVKAFNNPAGDNYDRYEPKCIKQILAMVKEWSDAVLFAHSRTYTHKDGKAKAKGIGDGVRVINTNKTPAWDAGNRYGMPDELPLSWAAVAEAIENGKPDSPEQIEAEIIEAIDKSQMSSDRKEQAKCAVARDKGDIIKLKTLLNKVRQAA